MARRLDTLMPRACGGRGRPVVLSILFVSLFACSLATSSHQQQSAGSWRHSSPGRAAGLLDPYLEPLYERPTVYEAPREQPAAAAPDDEQFLSQLKAAAEYLDEKLAAREREQQQRALLAKLGRLVDSSSSSLSAAAAGQGPAYSLGGYETGSGQEGNDVVVVAPSSVDYNAGSPVSSELSDSFAPNYRLLNEQQPDTYDNYKQLLQTLLGSSSSSDRAQPTEIGAPQKRESDGATDRFATKTDDRKLTTLIEEDEDVEGRDDSTTTTTTESATKAANETTSRPPLTSQPPPVAAAYGKVVYEQNNAPASESGVFGRLYAQLSRYLPFMSQISILRNAGSQAQARAENKTTKIVTTIDRDDHDDGEQLTAKVSSKLEAKKDGGGDDLAVEESRVEEQSRVHAKPSVSVSPMDSLENDDQDKTQKDNQKQLKVKVNLVKTGDQVVVASGKSGNAKRLGLGVQGAADNLDSSEPVDMPGQMLPVVLKSPQYNHLIRGQPEDGETEMGQGPVGSGSLLGKYIYAPTQHYYLNSPLPTTSGADQHHQLQAAARHFRPGDNVYGSYGATANVDSMLSPMKAAYAFQKDPNMIPSNGSLVNKTNDLYFLVMVGAFCVMAMAVVLAAGAFAYRVQQSRKSSQDTDYPTYGVVGPNNMSASNGGGGGKCGASAFTMGGYFMGPPGGVGGVTSKSGSAKHLAEHLYGANSGCVSTSSGANHGGSDSGLNSLGRSSAAATTTTTTLGNATKKTTQSSSASSLNNGQDCQVGGGGRHAPGSFMSAASQDAARMYHYQHQKQQMIISDRNSTAGGRHTSASDLDSEEENDDGSYTVYECPGLASAHEMEIKNPLFNDDQTP